MATTVTVKGQVTLPKDLRDRAGIQPGDRVEVRLGGAGELIVKKQSEIQDYKKRLYALAERRIIRDGITTDEYMIMMRGDPAEDPDPAKP